MPKWGLTIEQVESRPWGLEPDLLRADKTITNSVEGDVYVNQLERRFIDSRPMQRLRRVKQLGNTHLVYPDATHTRFSHSLGTLRAAQDLLDALLDQENRPHPQHDLLRQWRTTLSRDDRDKQIAEVVVLTRLGSLLHDLCHVAYGHTIEDDLELLERHDGNERRFRMLWQDLPRGLRDDISPELTQELTRLIVSKKEATGRRSRYPFVEDLVGNTICADLLDYLARDHRNLGLPFALGHRFLEGLYVTPSDHPHYRERVAIQVSRDGIQRADIITELLKVLRYRYEESERALIHHAKLAPDAMIGKLLSMLRDALWVDKVDSLFALTPEERKNVDALRDSLPTRPIQELRQASHQRGLAVHENHDATRVAHRLLKHVDRSVRNDMEALFLQRGDEGLLEHVLQESERLGKAGDSRRAAIAALAKGVIHRDLYKRVGHSLPEDRPLAKVLWETYGTPDARRRLELEAAEYINLNEKWHLVLWIPSPKMRLKPADVLVGGGDRVVKLHDFSQEVREIYEAHERLWSIGVYVHRDVQLDELRTDALLAWLRRRLGLAGWVSRKSTESVEEIVVTHFARERDLRESHREQLLAGVSGFAPTEGTTLQTLIDRIEVVAKALETEPDSQQ